MGFYNFGTKGLPQDHMVSTRFSAGGADEVGHWGRP